MKIIIPPKQHYQAKMSPDELQTHLNMKRAGASCTKKWKTLYTTCKTQRRPL